MPRFAVAPAIFDLFPTYLVAGVAVTGFDNVRPHPAIADLLAAANARAAERLRGVDPKLLPPIAAWRAAFPRAGMSASTYQSAVEALARRAAKGNPVPPVSPLVDLGNAVSLTHLVPVGAHDMMTWKDGTLAVRPAEAADVFLPMGSDLAEPPTPGEIIYASGVSVRTRRWVWRQSRIARIRPETTAVFFPIDGFAEQTREAALAAREEIARVATDAGAAVTQVLVDAGNPEAVW